MIHVILNVLIIALLGGMSFYFRKRKRGRIAILIVASALLFLAYFLPARPDIFISLFPFGNLIFYYNLYPWATALFLPISVQFAKGRWQKIRVCVLSLILFIVTLWPYEYFLLPGAKTGKGWINEDGVCLQTSFDSCTAAACVTLLHMNGIETTEPRVAELALTKEDIGTMTLGQYRALKLILDEADSNLKARVAKISYDNLMEANRPAIITVGLTKHPTTQVEVDLDRKYHWEPGVMHDVVFLGVNPKDPRKVMIGEPSFGRENWWAYELETLFKEYAVFLE